VGRLRREGRKNKLICPLLLKGERTIPKSAAHQKPRGHNFQEAKVGRGAVNAEGGKSDGHQVPENPNRNHNPYPTNPALADPGQLSTIFSEQKRSLSYPRMKGRKRMGIKERQPPPTTKAPQTNQQGNIGGEG